MSSNMINNDSGAAPLTDPIELLYTAYKDH